MFGKVKATDVIPKNIRIACNITAIIGLTPWFNFEKRIISYARRHRIFTVLTVITYLVTLAFAFWNCIGNFNKLGSELIVRTSVDVMAIFLLCQILIMILFRDLKRWETFLGLLVKMCNYLDREETNYFKITLIFVPFLVIHFLLLFPFLEINFGKSFFRNVVDLVTLTGSLLGFIINNLLRKIYEKNNCSLKCLVRETESAYLDVHRYVKVCQMRETGKIYMNVGHLVKLCNSLVLNTIWYPITSLVVHVLLLVLNYTQPDHRVGHRMIIITNIIYYLVSCIFIIYYLLSCRFLLVFVVILT